MRRLLLAVSFIFIAFAGSAQVGIGTENPDSSSQLDIVSSDRGMLIPRVQLTEKSNPDPVTSPAKSLLVFNTVTQNDVSPGFYYWYDNHWNRLLIKASSLNTINTSFDIVGDSLSIEDSDGNSVSVALSDIAGNNTFLTRIAQHPEFIKQLVTTPDFIDSLAHLIREKETLTILQNNGEGRITYTNEDGDKVSFPVSQSGQGDPNDNGVAGAAGGVYVDESTGDIYAYNSVDDSWEKTSGGSSTVLVDNGDGTVTLTSANGDDLGTINKSDLTDNGDGTYTFDDGSGNPVVVDVPASVVNQFNKVVNGGPVTVNGDTYNSVEDYLKEVVEGNETITNLVDNGDGTFTYTNESGNEVTFDANTTKLTDNGDGTYTFTNANGDEMTINTNADHLAYDDSNSN